MRQTKKMNVVISGYYGYGNAGDELILKAILQELKSINSKLNFIVLSGNPEETTSLHDVKSIHRYNLFKVIKAIYQSDILISGGGGLLQDVTSKRSISYYLITMFLAKIFAKKVVIYSQGIGPINSRFNIWMTKFALKKVDLITLRDIESKEIINSFKIRKNIFILHDPVIRLDMTILMEQSIKNDTVGIVVREVKDNTYYKEIIANVADKIIREKKLKVIFIPFHVNADLSIVGDIIKQMKEKAGIFNINRNDLWLDKITGVISSLKLLIGMRLHSIILAAKFNVPFVAISYDQKINNFLSSIDYNRVVNVDSSKDMSVENLLSEIDFVLSNKAELNASEKNFKYPEELKYYFT